MVFVVRGVAAEISRYSPAATHQRGHKRAYRGTLGMHFDNTTYFMLTEWQVPS